MKKTLFFICLFVFQLTFSQTLEMPNLPDGLITYNVSVKNQLIEFSDDGDWDFSETMFR